MLAVGLQLLTSILVHASGFELRANKNNAMINLHMNSTVTTINKDGMIPLPKWLRKSWQGSEILVLPSQDSVLVKRIVQPTLSELRPTLRKIGKKLPRRDLSTAVQWARRHTYAGRS